MFNKKGISYPLYFFQSVVLLVLILIFFGTIFFVIGIKQSPNLVIRPEAYSSSSELNAIIRSPTSIQQNNNALTVGELISLAYKDENYKDELNEELKTLLSKLPVVEGQPASIIATSEATRKSKEATWNFNIKIGQNNFLRLGEPEVFEVGSYSHLAQSMSIPLENGETATVTMYFGCFDCTNIERADIALRKI